MTGSELAGHRLLESARRVVLRTTLLARRGGTGPPLKRTPTARRSAPPPAPSGGGQSVAIGPGRRDRQVSLRPVHGDLCSPPLWSKRGGSRCAARPRQAREGARNTKTQKNDSAVLKRLRASAVDRECSPVRRDPAAPYSSSTGSSRTIFTRLPTHETGTIT